MSLPPSASRSTTRTRPHEDDVPTIFVDLMHLGRNGSYSGEDSSDYGDEEEEEEEGEAEEEEEEEDDEDDDDEARGEDNPYEDALLDNGETNESEGFDSIQHFTDLNPSSSSPESGWISPRTFLSRSIDPATGRAHLTLSSNRPGTELAGPGRERVRGRNDGLRDGNSTSYSQTRTAEERNNPDTRSSASSFNQVIIPERSFIPPFVIDPHTSFLKAGRSFTGTQNLMSTAITVAGFGGHKEEWEVRVTINSVDLETGTIIGLMEALNVPATATTVVTYWEGEIIDFINHTLWTGKWQADANIDLQHWRKFDAFKGMDDRTIKHGFRSARHIHQKYIFMRWKERFFINMTAQDSGLTIAGFYYVCIRRIDGHIEGFYFDPSSTPYQKLVLHPWNEGRGVSFSDYSFA